MDVQLESAKVRAERERRAWSQEHLAEVAGVSLRTVQRLEIGGAASFETAGAIAAAFDLKVEDLQLPSVPSARRKYSLLRYAAVTATLVVLGVMAFMRTTYAGDVQLEINITLNSENLGQHRMAVAEGKSAEIRIEKQVRLFVNPRVTQEGRILLSMRVEEPSGARWVEIGEPRLLVENGIQAEVSVTSPKGNAYRISIRPQRS